MAGLPEWVEMAVETTRCHDEERLQVAVVRSRDDADAARSQHRAKGVHELPSGGTVLDDLEADDHRESAECAEVAGRRADFEVESRSFMSALRHRDARSRRIDGDHVVTVVGEHPGRGPVATPEIEGVPRCRCPM